MQKTTRFVVVPEKKKVMATQTSTAGCTNLVGCGDLHLFVSSCIEACGAPKEHASNLADVLVEADKRGHYSHGLNRLEMYCKEIGQGQCDATATPLVVKETAATALVNARNGIGMVISGYISA